MKDNFIIPNHPKKKKIINLNDNDILERLGKLRRNQKQQKEILSHAQGQLIQISKNINQILDELEQTFN